MSKYNEAGPFETRERWIDSRIGPKIADIVRYSFGRIVELNGDQLALLRYPGLAQAHDAFFRLCHSDTEVGVDDLKQSFESFMAALKKAIKQNNVLSFRTHYAAANNEAQPSRIDRRGFEAFYYRVRELLEEDYYVNAWESTAGSVIMGDLEWKIAFDRLPAEHQKTIEGIVRALLEGAFYKIEPAEGSGKDFETAGELFKGMSLGQILQLCSQTNEELFNALGDPVNEALYHLRCAIARTVKGTGNYFSGLRLVPKEVEVRLSWAQALFNEKPEDGEKRPRLRLV